ncbi:MAG: glycosyltransferase family 4 protein [Roseiflexus sp.]|jgi:glycosyltransferase involved in cell wall biosynthesis|nr:glycosyltransferase family 4 protein [Roseiflexus sp.]MBO9333448.1 glycosyltransferase family 4 protein [Roseiflexus sp.]MBO9365113.1 glycosyltransferase family 4 protein [Roseiflexus sp.]MBO9382029.1 glycosyltransferase family 4 protein [Roseiflexus sp.]MBO9387920.1 glycosyltransferase family 4 protein [Roseiflexus sp.]
MSRSLRIVHIVGSAFAGGWAFHPLCLLRDAGHDVFLICPEEGPLPERTRAAGIPTRIEPFPRRIRHTRSAAAYIARVASWLRCERIDVVHNHLAPTNVWGRLAARVAGVPVRLTQWPGPLPLEIPVSRRIEMALAPLDSAIIASSTATQRIYETCGVMHGRIHLIYYGFPFDPFDPMLDGSPIRREFGIAPDAPLVTMIAYMYSPMKERSLRGLNVFDGIGLKGHEILIEAAAHVRASLPDVRFLIVGDALVPGEAERYKQKLYRIVADLGLQQTVLFAGKRTDIPAILAASDVAAVPSLSENVGGAVEPLLMERPVVASAVGGLPDVVRNGETGYLVPPRDPQALADALLHILSLTPAARRAMGRRGRAIVQELFDLNKTVGQTMHLYEELLSAPAMKGLRWARR